MSLPKMELWSGDRQKAVSGSFLKNPSQNNGTGRMLLPEDAFVSMLHLERRRAERAEKRFVLMLVDIDPLVRESRSSRVLAKICEALNQSIRETDIIGWYLEDHLVGVIGTEIGRARPRTVQDRLQKKVREAFNRLLPVEKSALISISFHFFPEEWEEGGNDHSANSALYPDLSKREESRKLALGAKRAIDIVGSALALILLAPIYLIAALAIKLTSKGPVLFRQQRLGQYGKAFTVLKFRSMRTDCDEKIHQEFVHQFINGRVEDSCDGVEKPVFKIKEDPRVTSVGKFLRKTSLDEVPQFWNVLRGDMSLVGPRPPIAYEFRTYGVWHRRRVLEIKPGITGLWQVTGRSRIRFDDMVRLDLKYARAWSLWLDIKILMRTPMAVFSGDGAH